MLRKPGPTKPEVHLAALPRIASVPAQVGKHVTNCCKRCMPRLVVMALFVAEVALNRVMEAAEVVTW